MKDFETWKPLRDTDKKSLSSHYIINSQTAEIRRRPKEIHKQGDYDNWIVVKSHAKNPKKAQYTRIVELSEYASSALTRGPHIVKNEMYRAFIGEIPSDKALSVDDDPETFALNDVQLENTSVERMNDIRSTMESDGWRRHPLFEYYLGSHDGQVYSLFRERVVLGSLDSGGYTYHKFRQYNIDKITQLQRHRFIWECFNGLLDHKYDVDHIRGVTAGDQLSNLQKMTRPEHNEKTKRESTTVRERIAATNAKPIYRYKKDANGEEVQRDEFPLGAFTAKTARGDLVEVPSQDTILKYVNKDQADSNGWFWNYIPAETIDGEIWKFVDWDAELTGLEVSSIGRVRSPRFFATFGSDVAKKPLAKSQKYNHIGLNIKALVCQAFNGPPPAGQNKEVSLRRKDIKYPHEASNLSWSTAASRAPGQRLYGFFAQDNKDITFGEWFGDYSSSKNAADIINKINKETIEKGQKGDETKCDSSGIAKIISCKASTCGKDNKGRKRTFVVMTDAKTEIGANGVKYVRVNPGVARGSDKRCSTK